MNHLLLGVALISCVVGGVGRTREINKLDPIEALGYE